MIQRLSLLMVLFTFLACENKDAIQKSKNENNSVSTTYQVANHSYSNIDKINTEHLHLNLKVDFDNKIISGVVQHQMNNKGATEAIFDIRDLIIKKVTLGKEEREAAFTIGDSDSILGAPLIVEIEETDELINIYYQTTEKSEALGWMDPELTEDGKFPFLYTQGEAILTRTWIPCQDLPVNRITYSADVQVPSELLALMSAENPTKRNEEGKYSFRMDQAIPSYLIALAVGEIEFLALDDRSGVYAEPAILEAATAELASIPDMIHAAEKLYGEYQWGRYDVLFLPYSFPFGGMENPRLTFATPTILAGDGSLVTLIAHELAHSWSGNLVTMANWDDFWLNEGFTVYIENRIMEEVDGKEIADMLMLINYQELEYTIERLNEDGLERETHLKLDLTGKDPDDGMTDVAYNKGALFLMTLEEKVGRERFDAFLLSYFNTHKFQSIVTEDFVAYITENLLEKDGIDFDINEWIYGPGIPANAALIESQRFTVAENLAKDFKNGGSIDKDLRLSDKTTQEWIAFIRAFEGELAVEKMEEIDAQFNFRQSGNSEIMAEWYVLGIQNDYMVIRKDLQKFLMKVGRRKFLEPLYETLRDYSEESKAWANELYIVARPHYHAISFNTIDQMLAK